MTLTYPDIDPVALAIGPLEIRWYALAYLAGILLGWRYALYLAGLKGEGKRNITAAVIDDFLPWAIIGVIVGGRLGYVLFYQLEMYLADPLEIIKVWHGGMSFHGGAAGVFVAMAVYSWRHKLSFLRLTDIVACVVPIGLFFGRVANFINGELFGRVTSGPLGMVFPGGGLLPRHPSQLYEAALEGLVLGLVLLFFVHRAAIRARPGLLTGMFIAGYGLARFTIEFFREPDPQIGYIADWLTMGQILSLPMVIGGGALVAVAVWRGQSGSERQAG